MTTTIITRSTLSTSGYALIITEDDVTTTVLIDEVVDGGKTLKLPTNPSNRKYFSIKKVEEAGGELELSYKETVKLGANTNRKALKDYLTEEEKAIIEELMGKARERQEAAREAAKKPMSKEEKLRAKIAKYEAELAALTEEEEEA